MTVQRVMPVLTVSDLGASRDAYVAVFGLTEVMNLGWIVTLAGPGDSGKPRNQVSLMTKDATAPDNPNVSIEVDDVDAAHEAAVAAGLSIVHPLSDEEWGVRRFFFADPAGNVINVLSHQGDL
jgi:catechol 2,3-dioxygenase-like lactoylglutathione lyase family enzyme